MSLRGTVYFDGFNPLWITARARYKWLNFQRYFTILRTAWELQPFTISLL